MVLLGIAFLAYPLVFFASRFLPNPERKNWRLLWQGMGCRWALAYLRCRVNVQGTPPHRGMLASNHQGYMDILVLGSLDPASFVAKAEIRWWPIFGLFSWWAGTIFLERRNKMALQGPLHETINRLREDGRVVVFPEGTDSDGTGVLPFHSSFFEAAIRAQCPVIPVAIRYSAPEVSRGEEVIYWKDRRFLPHLIRLLGVGGIRAQVTFGKPMEPGSDRKELTRRVYREVARMVREGERPRSDRRCGGGG
ncbi:MAG: 1-acyl-sn-glycerol-3-phosphate acyltransferase [Verrucomicrobia bacterium]|nr:1-acyl-sn-glycerol-3-phosphate acyltransferase [Verrucomicrobiota bacterium]